MILKHHMNYTELLYDLRQNDLTFKETKCNFDSNEQKSMKQTSHLTNDSEHNDTCLRGTSEKAHGQNSSLHIRSISLTAVELAQWGDMIRYIRGFSL